jgi:hypothetical protein
MCHHWSEPPPSKYWQRVLIVLAVALVGLAVVVYLLIPKIQ